MRAFTLNNFRGGGIHTIKDIIDVYVFLRRGGGQQIRILTVNEGDITIWLLVCGGGKKGGGYK